MEYTVQFISVLSDNNPDYIGVLWSGRFVSFVEKHVPSTYQEAALRNIVCNIPNAC
jgi:hypothetical protein